MKLLIYFFLSLSIYSSQTNTIDYKNSVLEIKITAQSPNYLYPWQRKKPITNDAIGIIVEDNKILVLNSLLEYHTSIEIKKQNGASIQAKIIKKDYEANLSLVELEDKTFLLNKKPVIFESNFNLNSSVTVLNLNDSGIFQYSKGYIFGLDQEVYPLSSTRLPFLKLNSNEKLDGNGDLVLEKNKPIGILYKFTSSKNSGKVIPGFVISQFLKSKTKNSSFPFKGFKFKSLIDEASREYYGLNSKQEGVIITEVLNNSSATGVLELGDIILEFGNQKIDSEGYFVHSKFGKQLLSLIAHTELDFGYRIGSLVPIKILRNKKELQVEIKLKSFPYESVKIPYNSLLGEEPKFLIAGGFIFTELSEFLLKEYGSNWRARVDKKLLYLNDYHKHHSKGEKGKLVLMVQVLPDPSNNGYHNLSFDLVNFVNGKEINSIQELQKIIYTKNLEGFVDIELENQVNIVLDKSNIRSIDSRIKEKFSLESLSNF
jgi:S1-C subfamily serine protease